MHKAAKSKRDARSVVDVCRAPKQSCLLEFLVQSTARLSHDYRLRIAKAYNYYSLFAPHCNVMRSVSIALKSRKPDMLLSARIGRTSLVSYLDGLSIRQPVHICYSRSRKQSKFGCYLVSCAMPVVNQTPMTGVSRRQQLAACAWKLVLAIHCTSKSMETLKILHQGHEDPALGVEEPQEGGYPPLCWRWTLDVPIGLRGLRTGICQERTVLVNKILLAARRAWSCNFQSQGP